MPDDYAGSTDTSGSLTVGGAITGNIETSFDEDWFRIFLQAGRTYRFDLEGFDTFRGTLSDPSLQLIDGNGRSIHAQDYDDGIGFNSNLIFTPTASGFYYLSAFGFNTGTYSLSAIDTGVNRAPALHGATPSSVPRPLTGDNIIDAATHGYYWLLNSSRTINWALADGFYGETWPFPQFTVSVLASVFNNIATYANVIFNYTGYYSNPPEAFYAGSDITISLDSLFISGLFGGDLVWGIGNFPDIKKTDNFLPLNTGNVGYQGAPGDAYLNVNSRANSLSTYEPGSAGYAFVIHELGHTLGLKHPHDNGGTGRPTLADLGAGMLDEDWFSVMSYNDDYDYITRQFWDPATPMAMDVLALQYLYGPNLRTNAGNSTYTLTQNNQYQTIWDAGGTDIINVSSAFAGWEITLPTLQPSSLVSTKVGYAIPANGAFLRSPLTLYWLMGDIENIIGSAFADSFEGNAQSNIFNGRGGNDTIIGGSGFDVAVYAGARRDYALTSGFNERILSDRTSGRDGTDTLSGVERLKFSDGVLAFDNLPSDNAGRGYLVYRAAFDRVPDAPGLGYWIRELDRGQDFGAVVAASFIASPEFIARNGANTSDAEFTALLYQNVLNRVPDQAGNDFWLGQLNGGYARSNMLASFAISDENVNSVAPLISDGIFFV